MTMPFCDSVSTHSSARNAAPALRAALSAHERARAQRSHLRRLRRESSARVVTLPFVFETELGLAQYERLAGDLARRLA